MSKAITNQVFDYAQVSEDDKAKLIYFEGQLFKSRKRVADEIIKHGEILHGVQQVLANYSNGVFCEWLEATGTSSSSAYRAIDSYQSFNGFSQLGNLEVSAMYALTKNDGARKKAMRLADKGVKVTHAMAKQLIEDCQPKLETIEHDDSGEDGRTDSDGTEPPEETAHQPADDGMESAGEDIGAENDEWDDVEESIPTQKPPAKVGEKCPNCLGTKWRDGACVKCSQPEGEPAGEVDEDRIGIQRSKTRKTIEALMRAFDDLHMLCPTAEHQDCIDSCKSMLRIVGDWK